MHRSKTARYSIILWALASSDGGVFKLSGTHGRIMHMGHDRRSGSNLNPAMQSVLNDEQERVSDDGKDEQHDRNRDHLFSLQELHRVDDQKT